MAFHYQNGIHFERLDDGSVRIFEAKRVRGVEAQETFLTIDPASWCSIISAVSRKGESSEQYREAKLFHGVV